MNERGTTDGEVQNLRAPDCVELYFGWFARKATPDRCYSKEMFQTLQNGIEKRGLGVDFGASHCFWVQCHPIRPEVCPHRDFTSLCCSWQGWWAIPPAPFWRPAKSPARWQIAVFYFLYNFIQMQLNHKAFSPVGKKHCFSWSKQRLSSACSGWSWPWWAWRHGRALFKANLAATPLWRQGSCRCLCSGWSWPWWACGTAGRSSRRTWLPLLCGARDPVAVCAAGDPGPGGRAARPGALQGEPGCHSFVAPGILSLYVQRVILALVGVRHGQALFKANLAATPFERNPVETRERSGSADTSWILRLETRKLHFLRKISRFHCFEVFFGPKLSSTPRLVQKFSTLTIFPTKKNQVFYDFLLQIHQKLLNFSNSYTVSNHSAMPFAEVARGGAQFLTKNNLKTMKSPVFPRKCNIDLDSRLQPQNQTHTAHVSSWNE